MLGTAACTTTVFEPAPAAPPPAPAREPAPEPAPAGEVSVFYDSRAPYGSWVVVAGYGQVWVPTVSAWWRPYTEGRWAYTDEGWTWVGTEPWGWAAYHYGRWYWDAEYGWAWVPGTVWAPAWVAWRSGGGHLGWAPLPPSVRWEAGIGFSGGDVDFAAVIAPQHWCFVDERYITAPTVREYIAPPARNITLVRVTNNITNYTVVGNRIVNNSVDVTHVERVTGRPVVRYRLVDRGSPAALQGRGLQDDEIPIVRHAVAPATGARLASPSTTPLPRATPTARVETLEEIRQRHALETQQLQDHYVRERTRLEQIHQADQSQPPSNLTADQVRARHLAEQQALEAQHQSQVRVLAHRHERELANANKATVKAKPTPKPTPKPKPGHHQDGEDGQH